MANSVAFRPVGPSYAISVGTGTGATATTITPNGNDQVNFAGFLNTNNFPVTITIAPTAAPTAVAPIVDTPTDTVVLGISMQSPMVIAVPVNSFSVAGVAGSSGTIYVTPLVAQN
jgi:hypothetical protein